MNDLMAHATRLTRAGRLREATRAIQQALGGSHPQGPIPPSPPADTELAAHGRTIEGETLERASPTADDVGGAGNFREYRHKGATRTLDCKLYLPPAQAGPSPLLLMLHGCTQDPDDFAVGTRMNEVARERGVVVVYPAQPASANPQGCWNWFDRRHQMRDAGEPALLAGLVKELAARPEVDSRRIYVAGLSAGGAMAAVLGATWPDRFAAVGIHSGLPTGVAGNVGEAVSAMKGTMNGKPGRRAPVCAQEQHPPLIVFHGSRDKVVAPSNADALVAQCLGTRADHITEVIEGRSPDGTHFTRETHGNANGQTRCEQWTVHGGGHAWSGGSAAGSHADARGPCASAEMVRFFLAQT